jgi:hypothetical protein
MANLPDLDTSDISLFAWWSLGVNITIAEVLGILETYTQYDNGVDGTLRMTDRGVRDPNASNRIYVRCRSDGLIVAYMKRSLEVQDGNQATTTTQGDTADLVFPIYPTTVRSRIGIFTQNSYHMDFTTNTTLLAATLDVMENTFTAGGKVVVNTATVPHYDFEYPTANHFYIIGMKNLNVGSFVGTFTQPPAGNTILGIWSFLRGDAANIDGTTKTVSIVVGALSLSVSFVNNASARGAYRRWTSAQVAANLQPLGTANQLVLTISETAGSARAGIGMLVIYCVET